MNILSAEAWLHLHVCRAKQTRLIPLSQGSEKRGNSAKAHHKSPYQGRPIGRIPKVKMDTQLLADIASAHGDYADPAARKAFGEFYVRHADWLCRRVCRTKAFGLLDSRDAVQDVVQETFFRAYKGAHTFNPRFLTAGSCMEALVRGWLGAIANRVIADILGRPEPGAVKSVESEPQRAIRNDANDDPVVELPIVKALQEELLKLTPLQQDILTAANLYYQPDTAYQRLPNGVTKMLAEKHGTSLDNIRQVRRRTIAGLRKKLIPLLEEI